MSGKKGRFVVDCAPKFGLRELTGYKVVSPVRVGRYQTWLLFCPYSCACGGSLLLITSESAGELDSDTHDDVVGIRTWLQVNSDTSYKLAVWLSRDDVVNTFRIRGPGTVECTIRAPLGDGKQRVDEGKLVVSRKPQKRGSVAVTHPGIPAICPNYFTTLLSYSYIRSSVSIYSNKQIVAAGLSTNNTIQIRPKHILLFSCIRHRICRAIYHNKSDSVWTCLPS